MRFLFQKTSLFRERRLIYNEEVSSNNYENVESQNSNDVLDPLSDAQQIQSKIEEHMKKMRDKFEAYKNSRPNLQSAIDNWKNQIENELNTIQKQYEEESSHVQKEELKDKRRRIELTLSKIENVVDKNAAILKEKMQRNKARTEMLNTATTELDSILDQDTKILYFSQMELMLQNDQDRLVLKKMLGKDLYRMFMILHTNKDLSKLNSRDKSLYKRFIMRYGGGGDGKDSARGFVSKQELDNPGLETPIRIEALRRLRRLNRQNKLPKWIDNEAINILHKPNYTPSGTSGVTYLKNGVSWEASRVLTAAFGLTFGANVISSKTEALSNPWVVPSAFGTYVSYKSLEMGGFAEAWEWLKTTEGQRMNAVVDTMKQSDPEFLKWIYMEQDSEVESYFDVQKKSKTRKALKEHMKENPYKKEITNTDMRNIGARQETYMGEESPQHYQYRYKMFQKLKEWGITTKNKKAFKQLVGVKIPMTFAYAKARQEVSENYESKPKVEKPALKQNQSRPDIQSSPSSTETIKNQEVAKSPELSDAFKDFYKKRDALRPYLSLLINDVDFVESFKKQVEAIESGKKTPDSLITAENIMTLERKLLITVTLLEMSKDNRINVKDVYEKLFKGADADYLKKALPVLAKYVDVSDGIGNDLVELATLHQENSDVLNAIGYVLAEANIIQSFDTLVSKVVGAEKTGKILDHITLKSPKFLYDIAHTQLTSRKYDGLSITPSRILLHMTNPEIGKNAENMNEFGEVLHYVYSTKSLVSSTGLDVNIQKKIQANIDDYKGFAKNKAKTIIRDMIDDYSDVSENKDGLAFILVHCFGGPATILEKTITEDELIGEIQKNAEMKKVIPPEALNKKEK